MDKMIAFIEKLRASQQIFAYSEAQTKSGVICPLFQLLGWNPFEVEEVCWEYKVKDGRVDFVLLLDGAPKVFVEAKRTDENLEDHQEQLLNYAFYSGAKLAVLTNGITWWFYLPLEEGSWEQRKFYSIDLFAQEPLNIAEKFTDFLAKENVKSGSAIQKAKHSYEGQQKEKILAKAVPKAWNKIIEDQDEILIELINTTTEKICGFKTDEQSIAKFLTSNQSRFLVGATTESAPSQKSKPASTPTTVTILHGSQDFTNKTITGFSFGGTHHQVRTFKDLLLRLSGILSKKNPAQFEQVLTFHGRTRPIFTRNLNELRMPEQIGDTGIYVETNMSAKRIVGYCHEMLAVFGQNPSELVIDAF